MFQQSKFAESTMSSDPTTRIKNSERSSERLGELQLKKRA
jgi:hypothetical protein